MSSLASLWGSKLVTPAYVPVDDIYPTHFLDNAPNYKDLMQGWMMRFNDVLDADKLHDALWRLLEIGDWRKLGGRLRVGEKKLEIHVPTPFTKDRPPVAYNHHVFDMKLKEHPLGKVLPDGSDSPATFPGPRDFEPFNTAIGAPTKYEDYVTQDIPQISLYVVSFQDATLVSITWLHTLFDAMGLQALIRSWSLVLAGREDEVPPLLGAREDILAEQKSDQKPALCEKAMGNFGLVLFLVYLLWDVFWDRKMTSRMIHFPKQTIERIRERATLDLGTGDFVSDADLILAWGSKMVAASQHKPRPLMAMNILDMRSKLDLDPKGVYIQNAVSPMVATLPVDLLQEPIGLIAAASRRAFVAQSTTAECKAMLQMARDAWDANTRPQILIGPSNSQVYVVTSWAKAKLVHQAQFGPAVVKQGESDATKKNPPGTMVYHHHQSFGEHVMRRNIIVSYGKDLDGGYWLSGLFPGRTWDIIDKNLAAL